MKWKLVPCQPTEGMKLDGARSIGKTMMTENHNARSSDCYTAMTSAAPNPSDDPELVEKVALALCCPDGCNAVEVGAACIASETPHTVRAVIKALEEPK